ncbi:MAG: TGS domain-containing protein [Chloroflexota bacterium]|nr:TGS domain-containing protein [Chloroflexota bacterium]
MPANLPPQYFEAEKRYRTAKDPEEKIRALEAMLAIMPRHKGTDKLHAGLRRKIAKFSQEAERKYATARRAGFYIKREGAGQVMLIGPPSSGKSQILVALTEALTTIAAYPFTTKTPLPGMMRFEDIQIQLVDTPPIGYKEMRILLSNTLRGADLIAIVIDLSWEPLSQLESTLRELGEARIEPLRKDIGEITPGNYPKKMLIVGNKDDLEGSNNNWDILHYQYATIFPTISISAKEGNRLEELKKTIFELLDIIRVYTKSPGSKVDLSDPMILKKDSTVEEAAEDIHKDIRAKLKYAVIWGSGKYEGQRVGKRHVLQDRDIIEFHT